MRRRLTWAGVGLVLVLFGAPLFIGLGRADLENDEAIYSFAVDRILETGDWLTPKSSPSETEPFLEKPPLKMWIVAAGIRAGLPHDEFGLRLWDALFGAGVFVYVFLLAARQSNNVAGGLAAALILFVQLPLLVIHGIRSNNMEAPLSLSYAGGMFHFLQWSRAAEHADRRRHVFAAAVYFVLGFMTKFVAALFLPVVMAAAVAIVRPARAAFLRDWQLWSAAAGLAAVLILPWFVYEHLKYGPVLWRTILGLHVVQRFTTYVDPSHVKPWWYYFVDVFTWLDRTDSLVWVVGGLVLLGVGAIRRELDAVATLLWFAVPICAISFGTSKLQHYMYPFLAPLAIAGGVAVGWAMNLAQQLIAAALKLLPDRQLHARALRIFCRAIAAVALAVGVVTMLHGPIAIEAGGRTLFKNGGIVRPWLIMILFAIVAGWQSLVERAAVPLLVLAVVPLPMYRTVVNELDRAPHPMRSAIRCVMDVQRAAGGTAGVQVDARDENLAHPPYYYLRRIRPWDRAPLSDEQVAARSRGDGRPLVIAERRYRRLVERGMIDDSSLPSVRMSDTRLLLPGSFASCAKAAGAPQS